MRTTTVVLDLDGTLVDSVPAHVLAWRAAFRDVGISVPSHHVQRAIGLGSDRLVTALAGASAEGAVGDEVRERHAHHLDRLFAEIGPTDGAAELLEVLVSTGHTVVLASSADRDLTDRLLDLVDGAAARIGTTVSGDDAAETKPAADLVETALREAGVGLSGPSGDSGDSGGAAVVVGDAVWDVRAAGALGLPCIALLTGGISAAELRDAGAVAVHDSPRALARHVSTTGALLPRDDG